MSEAVTEHVIRDDDGTFRARVDVASPGRRLIVEYDADRLAQPAAWDDDERRATRVADATPDRLRSTG